ncbi:GDP-L-fucose synthase [Candidatus Pelagibacter sp.]|nr:GDP-L-fucose synthase [Candidatus Pelagibacter sp.]
MKIKKNDKIYVAGHTGLVGSAIIRNLKINGYTNIITATRNKIDLMNQKKTLNFLKKIKPKFIFIAAAHVGGINANNIFRATFIYNNLTIQNNLINGAFQAGVKKLIFLGSSCVYPKDCKQPIKEEYLLSGPLEKTNEPYAVAKIAGIKLCESYNHQYKTDYLSIMPCNTYGPGDNYNLNSSHFLPALLKKIHQIKKKKENKLNLWGTGKPKREFIYVDDLADACVFFMNKNTKEKIINIGSGLDNTIYEISKLVLKILNVKTKIIFNKSKPDGTKRKLLDISVAKKYGWKPKTSFKKGILNTYINFKKN